ncbi:hypothetical protein PFICI_06492 [Pestalotiopsis fici W106-1]|uniref:Heterokaryon incompatibility domain-containing protein n=1 Tax=Pestalotiopsis fici (strain W106-1 / CGMCC3.15140) TaxID=1229662 RepID=W3X611_PESFW|nr:uncharacterized protein PFICI_06492 [Pestalotiopsis fici W106-1]ETS81490.1 hypothetical protein PFICI_06492 [Pestalotiopsis fici W106-1]
MDVDARDQESDGDTASVVESCSICRRLWGLLTKAGSGREKIPIEDLIDQKPCNHHDPFISFLIGEMHSPNDTRRMPEVLVTSRDGEGGQMKRVRIPRQFGQRLEAWQYLFVETSTETQVVCRGRELDSDWVEVEVLRHWIQECVSKHGDLCCNPFKIQHTHPAWLIDVVNNCLVPGDGVVNYVALSYRWGSTSFLQTELSILNEIQQPGALLQPKFANFVSPMIQYAAKLINVLGERYLWADALCIVQNDSEHSKQQLLFMGAIYASAKFTIVATDGDANHGIPGLRGISQSRNLRQDVFSFGRENKIILRDLPLLYNAGGWEVKESSPYFSRAWTFQEFFLSKRRLIIGNKQFHWSCSTATCHEELLGRDSNSHDTTAKFQTPDIVSGNPNFDELVPLFREYISRDLTFPGDALAGASGLISILARSFVGGFIYGLPEMRFESALMWYGQPKGTKRRIHSGQDHSILPGSQLPSWSWLGWQTSYLEFIDENSGELYDDRPIIIRITQWYSHETSNSSTKFAIRSTLLHRGRDSPGNDLDDQSALAQGWEKEEFDPQKHSNKPDGHEQGLLKRGNFVYKHSRLPGKLFWFPFPLADFTESSNMNERPQHPFLSCKTRRGWFRAKRKSYHLSILGITGDRVGNVWADSLESRSAFMEMINVELVAICLRRYPRNEANEGDIIENPQFMEKYCVLWIEWIGGVAYRKGNGRVDKLVWESHDLKEVDLVLG